MQTYTGQVFWPLDPRPEEIFIEDIAHGLSNICRYAGHCKFHYSVAQHCVLMANMLPKQYKLEGLLHDASEAYICDIHRSLKPFLLNYKGIENKLMEVIANKYGFSWPISDIVHTADNRMLATEKPYLMPNNPKPWNLKNKSFTIKIEPWTPKRAEKEFLKTYKEITNG